MFDDELCVKEATADDFYARRVSRKHRPLTHNQIMEQNSEDAALKGDLAGAISGRFDDGHCCENLLFQLCKESTAGWGRVMSIERQVLMSHAQIKKKKKEEQRGGGSAACESEN